MKGEWGGSLMKQWSERNDFASQVMFNSTHWMTGDAAKLYLLSIMKTFPGKTTGMLVKDKHPSAETSCSISYRANMGSSASPHHSGCAGLHSED
jgi:Fe-S cluster assembly scaffold protein SufB